MKRPSFQFYPADWRNNSKLRRCSDAARGVWIDVICLLHDSDEYGVCRWPLEELARAAGASLKLVKELVEKEVLKGSDKNHNNYIHKPYSAGKYGAPVVLVIADGNPCWYCSRLVQDEWARKRRGTGTRFSSKNQPAKPAIKTHHPFTNPLSSEAPSRPPTRRVSDHLGDGPTSTSTSSINNLANAGYLKDKTSLAMEEVFGEDHEL